MDRIRENPAELIRVVNVVAGIFMVLGGVGNLIKHSFPSIILGIYLILFGVATAGLEVRSPTEPQKALIHRYASFMHSWIGRGVFYILVAVLMLNYYVLLYIAGTALGVIGLAYIAIHFTHLLEAPSTMQPPPGADEAEPVWQSSSA